MPCDGHEQVATKLATDGPHGTTSTRRTAARMLRWGPSAREGGSNKEPRHAAGSYSRRLNHLRQYPSRKLVPGRHLHLRTTQKQIGSCVPRRQVTYSMSATCQVTSTSRELNHRHACHLRRPCMPTIQIFTRGKLSRSCLPFLCLFCIATRRE